MSKEWYLMTGSNNRYNGFENDDFSSFATEGFQELLDSFISTNVTLFNYDLADHEQVQCVVQGNIADTQLKSMERLFLFEIGTVKAGMYVFYDDSFWLITGYPGNNKIYEKATAILCQYCIRWQNSNGLINERWCSGTSASKYDVGENGNNVITESSNTFTLLMPCDQETLYLDEKRVFIDIRETKPTKVYKITRNDDILYNYGEKHGGILCFIADRKAFNETTDNQDLRICDYHVPLPPDTPTLPDESDILCEISGNTNLKIGIPKKYSVSFRDKTGSIIEDYNDFKWSVQSDFLIKNQVTENTIQLQVDGENYIGSSFLLQIIVDGNVLRELKISVNGSF